MLLKALTFSDTNVPTKMNNMVLTMLYFAISALSDSILQCRGELLILLPLLNTESMEKEQPLLNYMRSRN